MYVNNLNNILFHIGSLEVRYYGLAYALGFLLAWLLFKWVAKKNLIDNFSSSDADALILYSMLGIILGARFFFLLFLDPSTYVRNPVEFFYFWQGGMSFHGGLIGGIIAIYIFCKVKAKGPKAAAKKSVTKKMLQLFDVFVIAGALALFLGRLANFLNQELYGRVTDVAWCVVFPAVDALCRHPSQLYDALTHLITFFVLVWLYWSVHIRKAVWAEKFQNKPGFVFWCFVFLYGWLRFITNFWRDDAILIWGLSGGQILCVVMIIVGAAYLSKYLKKHS